MNGHLHAATTDFEPGSTASGKACRNGAGASSGQGNKLNQDKAGENSDRKRVFSALGEEGHERTHRRRRIHIEENQRRVGADSDRAAGAWKEQWNGCATGGPTEGPQAAPQNAGTNAVGLRYGKQFKV